VAAQNYAVALAAQPEDSAIALRAYRAALISGDVSLERTARAVLVRTGKAPADVFVLAFADAIAADDMPGATAALEQIGKGPLDFMTPSLRAWLAAQEAPAKGIAVLDGKVSGPLATRLAADTRALLLILDGKPVEGAALASTFGEGEAANDLKYRAAVLLKATGHADVAAKLAGDAAVADMPSGAPSGAALTRYGIATVFARLAAQLDNGEAAPVAVSLARAALRIAPDEDRADIALATAQISTGSADAALVTIDRIIAAHGRLADEATVLRIEALDRKGEDAKALDAARQLAEARGATSGDWQRYGDALIEANKPVDAAQAYKRALDKAGKAADWVLYLQLGAAYDQAGDWGRARPALEKAVAMAPESPVALNYLGYAGLEHGEEAAKSIKLLERAVRLKPDDYAILDSLAWAYFQQGNIARALPMLEQASANEPANATIVEHLGDAYWASGRRYEARYAWQAALAIADGADATRLDAKIADGPMPRSRQ